MADTSKPPTSMKLLLIGSSSVGKSSLLLQYTDNLFLPPEDTSATIGVDYKSRLIERDGKQYKLNMWDSAGQERFRSLTSSYYRNAQGVFLVFDLTSRETFDALPTWLDELEAYAAPDLVRVVVGNKTDKPGRQVSEAEAQAFAESKGATYLEATAKQHRRVQQMFDAIVDEIIQSPTLLHPAASHSSQSRRRSADSAVLPGGLNLGGSDSAAGACSC